MWFQFLQQGLSEPEFYGDLVYKFRNIMGRTDFTIPNVLAICGETVYIFSD